MLKNAASIQIQKAVALFNSDCKIINLIPILETGINVFKSNYQIIKNKKNYERKTAYECIKKLSMIIGCNI